MLTKLVRRKSCLGEEYKRDLFLVCAKRTETKFDLTKAVLPMKLSSLGCTMVTLKSETLLYLSTPELDSRLRSDRQPHSVLVKFSVSDGDILSLVTRYRRCFASCSFVSHVLGAESGCNLHALVV